MKKVISVVLAASLIFSAPYSESLCVHAAKTKSVTKMEAETSSLGSITVPEQSVQVTLDANGGTVDKSTVSIPLTFEGYRNGKGELCYDEDGMQLIPVASDETLTPIWTCKTELPTPTKSGYLFNGWAKKKEAFSGSSVYTEIYDDTLYATWVEDKGKVIYNATQNGGVYSTSDSLPLAADGENTIDVTPKAEKVGYSFVGWNTDPNAKTAMKSEKVTGDDTKILYAVFQKEVTYTFVDKVGSSTSNLIFYNNEQSMKINTPEVSDYPGWASKGWSEKTDPDSAVVGKSIRVGPSNKTLYAVYEKEVTVTFNSGLEGESVKKVKGTVSVNSFNFDNEKGFTCVVPFDAKEVDGMTFQYWQAETDKLEADEEYGNEVTFTEDLDFYAVYGRPVTLSFDTDGGDKIAPETKYVLVLKGEESYPTFDIPTPTRFGHTFSGWTQDDIVVSGSIMVDSDTMLKANWDAHHYTVKFNGNGSTSGAMDSIDVICGKSFKLPANGFVQSRKITLDPGEGSLDTKALMVNSVLTGWSTDPAKEVVYKDEEIVKDLTGTANETVELYAKWEPRVTYLPTPVLPGYVFDGWYDKDIYVGYSCAPTADMSLTAKWVESGLNVTIITGTGKNQYVDAKYGENLPAISKFSKEYTVTFNYNGLQDNTEEKVAYKFCGIFDQPDGLGNMYYDENYNPCKAWDKASSSVFLYAYWVPTSIELPKVEADGYDVTGWYLNGTRLIGKFSPTYDCTLYLGESTATYSITYDTRGGRLLSDVSSYVFGVGATLPRATKRGYAFYGWVEEGTESKDSTESNAVLSIGKTEFGDKRYYAKWVRSASELEGITDTKSVIIFDVPEGIEEIPDEFFLDCFNLERVTLPEGLVSIGKYAFEGCEKLKELTLPSTLESIGSHAFSGTAIETLTVNGSEFDPESVKDCDVLQTIVFNDPNCYISDTKLSTGITVKGYRHSTAQTYAVENGYNFESLGESWQVTFDCGFGNQRIRYVKGNEKMPETADVLIWFSNSKSVAFDGYVLKTDTPLAAAGTLMYDEDGLRLWDGKCAFGENITLTAVWKEGKKLPAARQTAVVKTFTKNSISYKVSGKTVTVTGGSGTKIKVPAKVSKNGHSYKVTKVKASAFTGNTRIRSVVLGKNVKKVGAKAFKNCRKLSSIVVKRKKISVGKGAIKGTSKLLVIKGSSKARAAFYAKKSKKEKTEVIQ